MTFMISFLIVRSIVKAKKNDKGEALKLVLISTCVDKKLTYDLENDVCM